MQVVVGLGNPGKQYQNTRHNVGWMVLDEVARLLQAPGFGFQKKISAEISKLPQVVLVKPQTFMNESGKAVRDSLRFYAEFKEQKNQPLPNVWVIHDDLDLVFGSFKIQFGTGPKIHNGLLSIYRYVGTDQFWHVRVGVDSRDGDRTIPGKDYVLRPFPPEEQPKLAVVKTEIATAVKTRLDTI